MGSRILLADDSITIQKVVNLTFAEEGIEVVAVSNGDMAERRLEEVNPDLVLADIFMPGKNGYELCEAIKNNPQFSKVPVVLLIGAFEPFNEAEARRVHADAHLTKPFESRTLVETVRRLISASTKPKTGPIAPAPPPVVQKPEPVLAQPVIPSAPLTYDLNSQTAVIPGDPPPPPVSFGGLDESAPLDFDYSPGDAHSSAQTDAQFASSESMQVVDFDPDSTWRKRTDELSFEGEQAPFQNIGLDDFGVEASQAYSPVSVAVEEDTTNFPLASQGTAVPSTFRNAEEFMLDFDKPELVTDQYSYEEVAFDVSSRDPLEVSASIEQLQPPGDPVIIESHNLKTTHLEPPPSYQSIEPVDTNPLEMPASAQNGDDSFGAGNMESEAVDPSSLLAVDEPLGDVLMDEASREVFPREYEKQFEQPLDHTLGNDALNIEFTPREENEQAAATGKMTATATADLEQPIGETFDFQHQQPVAEPEASEWQPIASKEFAGGDSFELISGQIEPVAQPESAIEQEITFDSIGETISDFSSEIPIAPPVEPASEASAEPDAVANSNFAAYSMWSEEETRFAPIDIEATTIDERVPVEPASETRMPETGFDFAPVESQQTVEYPATTETEAPVEQEPVQQALPESASPSAQAIELSPALIDEIVRRVVAQMSEAAVREIAWEVVPDCVERVIKEMTKQGLQNRV